MNTLVVGDIHGCYDELQDLLELAGLAQDDQVIALGDVMDRGPRSDDVYRWFTAGLDRLSLLGNHERAHLRWRHGATRPSASQCITRYQLGEEGWATAVSWMANLPLYLELPEALLVHGALEPGVPIEEQRDEVLTGCLAGEAYLRRKGLREPWYELYDGPKPVVVGHHRIGGSEPYVRADQGVYGLDTGAATGGRLTGLLLPAFRSISVPSCGNHWAAAQTRYAGLMTARKSRETMTFEDLDLILQDEHAAQALFLGTAELAPWRAAAEKALTTVMNHIQEEHVRIATELDVECRDQHIDAQAYARRYDSLTLDQPSQLRPLLQWMRKGQLDSDRLRRHLRPASALDLASRIEHHQSL